MWQVSESWFYVSDRRESEPAGHGHPAGCRLETAYI